jgi:hypothetical protein
MTTIPSDFIPQENDPFFFRLKCFPRSPLHFLELSDEISRLEWNEGKITSQSTSTLLIFGCDFLLALPQLILIVDGSLLRRKKHKLSSSVVLRLVWKKPGLTISLCIHSLLYFVNCLFHHQRLSE